jgi:hypothetical protein
MSRAQARRTVQGGWRQQQRKQRGILVKALSMSGLAEEAGLAYNEIATGVESVDRAGIAKKVAEYRPIGNIKGSSQKECRMDKRQHPRFPAKFHSSFTSVAVVSGEGNVADLSQRGCCVESKTSVHTGSTLTLRVHMLQDEPPITILEAVVRWTREGRFGLEFLSLVPEEWARLQHTVTQLELHPYQKKPTDETPEGA